MTSTTPESAEQFHALDRLPGFIWVHDPEEDRTVWVSSSWYAYSGLSPATPVEDALTKVIHPDDLPAMRELWTLHRERGHAYTSVARYLGSDGRYRHYRYTARPERGLWYGVAVEIEREAQALAATVSAAELLAVAKSTTLLFRSLTGDVASVKRQGWIRTILLIATVWLVTSLVLWVQGR